MLNNKKYSVRSRNTNMFCGKCINNLRSIPNKTGDAGKIILCSRFLNSLFVSISRPDDPGCIEKFITHIPILSLRTATRVVFCAYDWNGVAS